MEDSDVVSQAIGYSLISPTTLSNSNMKDSDVVSQAIGYSLSSLTTHSTATWRIQMW